MISYLMRGKDAAALAAADAQVRSTVEAIRANIGAHGDDAVRACARMRVLTAEVGGVPRVGSTAPPEQARGAVGRQVNLRGCRCGDRDVPWHEPAA